MNAARLLSERAAERPDAPAIVEPNGMPPLTFRELDEAAANVAGQLRGHGVSAGESVLLLVPMSASLYVMLAGLLRLGAVGMFPDPSSGVSDVERCCRINPPAAFIGTPKAHILRLLSSAVRRIPLKFSTGRYVPGAAQLRPTAALGAPLPMAACSADSPALITFTSGSTGAPKAALRTHGFLLAQQRALAATLELMPGEIDLATLPIFVLANLAAGVTTIIPNANLRRPGAIRPGPVLEQIQQFRPNRASGSPAFFERLVEGARAAGIRCDSFAKIYTGGAPVFPGTLDRIAEIAPGALVVAVYGSTEAEPIAHVERSEIAAADRDAMIRGRGLLAGRPSPSLRLAILRDLWGTPRPPMTAEEFAAASLSPEQSGEIVVSGAHVLKRYLHGAGEEETKFLAGGEIWHRTGDAGWLDVTGRLWLLGRSAARVSDSRGAFYPFSVECAAMEVLKVRRAAAIGSRGRRLLFLEAQDEARKPDVSLLSGPLAWAALDEIRFVRRIPVDRRHNAKVDYVALAELVDGH